MKVRACEPTGLKGKKVADCCPIAVRLLSDSVTLANGRYGRLFNADDYGK